MNSLKLPVKKKKLKIKKKMNSKTHRMHPGCRVIYQTSNQMQNAPFGVSSG
jgi:hypothetical protein